MAHTPTAVGSDRPALHLMAYAVLIAALAAPVLMASQFGLTALAIAAAAAIATALVPLAVLWWLGRRLPDRWSLIFGLSWGAAGAALIGLYVVQLIYSGEELTLVRTLVFAPVVEEVLKLLALAVVAVMLTAAERRRSGRLSFFLAATASGVGFAFTENLTYYAMWTSTAAQFTQDPVNTLLLTSKRAVIACLGHPLFTGLGAAVIAWALGRHGRVRPWHVLAGVVVAAGTHSIWNLIQVGTDGNIVATTAYGLALLAVAVPVAIRLRRPSPAPDVAAAEPPAARLPWPRLDHDTVPAGQAENPGHPVGTEAVPAWPTAMEAIEHRVRSLVQHDREAVACDHLERLAATRRRPADLATLRVLRLAVLSTMRDVPEDELDDAARQAWNALADHPEPRLLGRYHTSLGSVCLARDLGGEALRHLFDAESALRGAPAVPGIAEAWYELAAAYSRADLHIPAMMAYRQSRRLAGAEDGYLPGPFVPVRLAISRDHRGDTDGCVRALRTVMSDLERRQREDQQVPPPDLLWYGYAGARLAALGQPVKVELAPLLEAGGNQEVTRRLRQSGAACMAIVARRSIEALAILERMSPADEPLGAAELPRLRALAYATQGAFDAAFAAERDVTRLAAQAVTRLNESLLAAATARTAGPAGRLGRVDTPYLDHVTGLPDRRFLERHLEHAADTGAVLGLIQVHGVRDNPAAGLLLRRVASAISRALRHGDVIARYGVDRLAVVLHDAGPGTPQRAGQRMHGAVADEDWESLVPGTGVSIAIGWAVVDPSYDPPAAVAAADEELRRALRTTTS